MSNHATCLCHLLLPELFWPTPAQRKSAQNTAEQWSGGLDNPEHNPAPCKKASAARLRQFKSATPRWETGMFGEAMHVPGAVTDTKAWDGTSVRGGWTDAPAPAPLTAADRARKTLAKIAEERKADPRPTGRADSVERIGWAQRETARQTRQRRAEADLP